MTSEQEKVPTNDEMGGERISESKMQKIGQFTINSSKNLGKYMLETLKEMFVANFICSSFRCAIKFLTRVISSLLLNGLGLAPVLFQLY